MFKKSKSKFLLIVLVSISLLLSGCKQQGTETPTNEPVTLIWWNLFEPVENVRPLIEAYQTLHSNVTIEYAEKDLEDYRALLESNLTDGLPRTGPDIFAIHNTWNGTYESFLSPAPSSVMDPTSFRTDFYDFVANDFIGGSGLVMGVPMGVDTIAIIYNKDLLDEEGYTGPSSNWDDFKIQAKALTKKDGTGKITSAGFSAVIPDSSEFAFDVTNLLMLQSGGDILSSDGKTAIFGSDSDIQGAVSFYADFVKSANKTWDSTQEFDAAAFLGGKLAMYAAPSWRLLDMIKYNEAYDLGLNIGTAKMPQLESDSDIYWGSYWGQTVSKDSANADVAWDFLKFITEAEQLRTFSSKAKETRAFGELYPRRDMASELTSDELLKAYIESFPSIRNWEMVDGGKVKTAFDVMLEEVSTGSVATALLTAQSEVTQIIEDKGNLTGSQ